MKKPTRKSTSTITASIKAWADALDMDSSTIKKRMNRADIPFEPHVPISAKDIFRAMMAESDKEIAMTRKLNAEADKTERENLVAQKELYHLNEVEKLVWQEILFPLRAELLQMPKKFDAETREQLESWVDATMNKIGKEK